MSAFLKQYQEQLLEAFSDFLARTRELKQPASAFAEVNGKRICPRCGSHAPNLSLTSSKAWNSGCATWSASLPRSGYKRRLTGSILTFY